MKLIAAEVREFYGTHHTKMMVMFRHDDTAQVIIHTANLIHQDWTNLTQAVWRSPLLPLLASDSVDLPASSPPAMGTGHRFKHDLLQYFLAYGRSRTGRLVDLLIRHDFAAVRAAFVASVPGRHATIPSAGQTHWGWKGLQEVLRHVPSSIRDNRPVIVSQVSSIASLGTTDTWLTAFFDTLRTTQSPKNGLQPTCRIIFPTEDEVRRSLDGYRAGASIHLKTSSATGIKQLQYLRPSLCRWGEAVVPASAAQTLLGFTKPSDQPSTKTEVVRQAGRCRAAPHVSISCSKAYHTLSTNALTKNVTDQDLHSLHRLVHVRHRLGNGDERQPVQAGMGGGGQEQRGPHLQLGGGCHRLA